MMNSLLTNISRQTINRTSKTINYHATYSFTARRSIYHATQYTQSPDWHGTTIVCVRKNGRVCMMGDGMVSMGSVIVKPNAKKIRRMYPKTLGGERAPIDDDNKKKDGDDDDKKNEGTIVGFAGSTADAFTLLERLEGKLDEYPGQLARSCVELAKGWRTDKVSRVIS